ncbi:MAG: hypothetical protein SFW67_00260 [Myxococcaceae bacterium]|nr:hypothetical protein [Myxococcaceae bacterium]
MRWATRVDTLSAGPLTAGGARWVALVHAVHQLGQALAEVRVPATTVLSTVAVLIVWWKPRLAMAFTFAGGLVAIGATFPVTANHVFLGTVASLLLALLDARQADEARQLQRSLVALVLLALFHGGLAKLAHGAWFRGQTLAWLTMVRLDVRAALAPFLPAETLARLSALVPAPGAGPFELSGPLVLVSNVVWVLELVAPLALLGCSPLAHRARWLLPGLALSLQLVAHEWTFALLLVTLGLPLVAERKQPRVAVALMGLAGLLLVAQLHWFATPPWLLPTVFARGGPR